MDTKIDWALCMWIDRSSHLPLIPLPNLPTSRRWEKRGQRRGRGGGGIASKWNVKSMFLINLLCLKHFDTGCGFDRHLRQLAIEAVIWALQLQPELNNQIEFQIIIFDCLKVARFVVCVCVARVRKAHWSQTQVVYNWIWWTTACMQYSGNGGGGGNSIE